ncbi:Allophanate hydrolase subunit 1 [uncultured delta proteobacterium]|uniref:Allophanate hydrolase subunit 1 n=1 Tax=uncultured delta proteobacterium TaxID=34034 RepID=A0A212KH73_9DELT|nr:Allophanate hydrolase subunit 1 [uncultured delta proteobacterium]
MYATPKYLGAGEKCLVVEFSDAIDREANIRLQGLRRALEKRSIPGMIELVPTYRSLSIYHDPLVLSREDLLPQIENALQDVSQAESGRKRILVMPVLYGGEYGPDIANVAEHTGFSEEEVIRRHTAKDCYCFMMGFTPGFGYLGGMDEALETPRLKTPRTRITGGSVGIAGKQTGVYSIDSPGGWQLIGHTPLRLFDPGAEQSTIIDAGDWVRFRSIDEKEYADIKEAVAARRYVPEHIFEGGDA